MTIDIPEVGEEWFKRAKLRLPPPNAQDRHGWLILPIGATLVLALLVWAAQTPTRFVPRLKPAPFVYSGPSGSYACMTTLQAPVTTAVTATTSTAFFGGAIVECHRTPPSIP